MFSSYKEFLDNYIPEWYEVFDEYSDLDSEGNIFVYRKNKYEIKFWYNEKGQLHRIDGPARIGNGYVEYWINDKIHNINGPAYIAKVLPTLGNCVCYYLNSEPYSKGKWEIERVKYV